MEKLQCGRKRIGSRFRGFFHLKLLQPGPHCQTYPLFLKLAPRTAFFVPEAYLMPLIAVDF